MLFIDGGYLRKGVRELFGDDKMDEKIDYAKLRAELAVYLQEALIAPEVVRAYYYDAIPIDQNDERYKRQKEYTDRIKEVDFYEVRLARLKKSDEEKEGYKQKGVDVLLSIDMLEKAYENHYEWAMLLTGDDDYVDLVQAVKNAGKRVYGFYFEGHASQELIDSFDRRTIILKHVAQSFLTK
jgi:uncharacterized LabA/DUF88 family protein